MMLLDIQKRKTLKSDADEKSGLLRKYW